MFLGRKNQYCENDYSTKCNLQIQSDPYQITNGIFHRTRTEFFTIYIGTQRPQIAKAVLRKKRWSWRNHPSRLQVILQSYSHQDSTVVVQKQKYRPTEQDTKEARIYNGAKTASSINGAGKTGQLHV